MDSLLTLPTRVSLARYINKNFLLLYVIICLSLKCSLLLLASVDFWGDWWANTLDFFLDFKSVKRTYTEIQGNLLFTHYKRMFYSEPLRVTICSLKFNVYFIGQSYDKGIRFYPDLWKILKRQGQGSIYVLIYAVWSIDCQRDINGSR